MSGHKRAPHASTAPDPSELQCERCGEMAEAMIVVNDTDVCLECFDDEIAETVGPLQHAMQKAAFTR